MEKISDYEWTPKRVGEELIEAVSWDFRTGGRVGPSGIKSGMPQIMMDEFERLAEQWPLISDLEGRPSRRQYYPFEVSRFNRILSWQWDYLKDSPVVAGPLSLWLFSKCRKGVRYNDAIKKAGMSRATAYRQRDRALGIIGNGLTRDGVKRGMH